MLIFFMVSINSWPLYNCPGMHSGGREEGFVKCNMSCLYMCVVKKKIKKKLKSFTDKVQFTLINSQQMWMNFITFSSSSRVDCVIYINFSLDAVYKGWKVLYLNDIISSKFYPV